MKCTLNAFRFIDTLRPVRQGSVVNAGKQRGMALLSAIWVAAILAVMATTVSQRAMLTVDATIQEVQQTRAMSLHQSARRFAIAHLLQPRKSVAVAGLPFKQIEYVNQVAPVTIKLSNEAGYIDLNAMQASLVQDLNRQAQRTNNTSIKRIVHAHNKSKKLTSFRTVRQKIGDMQRAEWPQSFTFYSGFSGVNPLLANQRTLELIPGLANSEVRAFLRQSDAVSSRSLSTPIQNEHLHARVSSYYRLVTSFVLGSETYQQQVIVKLDPQSRQAYKVVARLP